MAEFGAKHPCFCPDNAEKGIVLGKLVAANLTVNMASGEIYADDELAEQVSEFSSGNLAMETDDLTDENAQVVYGCQVRDGEVIYNTDDKAPRGCLAYFKSLMRGGVKFYKGFFYPRARAALGNDSATTKGANITFTTAQTAFTIMSDDAGDWRKTKTFTDSDSAAAWCEQMTKVASYHVVRVTAQGVDAKTKVDKIGEFYVPHGTAFVLGVKGTAAALYDNGEDKKTSVSGQKYNLAAVTEDHEIAVIYTA